MQNQQSISNSEEGSKLITALKKLEKDFLIINSPQSISIFIDKAKSFQWRNVEKRAIELKNKCESGQYPIQVCSDAIVDLQSFVLQSNLSDKYIDAVIGELEYYKMQQEKISTYGHDFQNSFDQNVRYLNEKITQQDNELLKEAASTTTIKNIATSKTVSVNNSNIQNASGDWRNVDFLKLNNEAIGYASISLLVLITLIKIFTSAYKKIQQGKIKNNYFKVLATIQKSARVKVRSFGLVDNLSLSQFTQYFSIIEKTFSLKKKLNGELHFILLRNEKATRLEVKYLSSESFHLIYDNQSSDLGQNIKILSAEIDNSNGEFLISTKFNSEGKVSSSSLNLILPN